MKIGLDLSVIQTPHRMRGIGATAINFVKHLSEDAKKSHYFVLFLYEENQKGALNILNLEGLQYEIRTLKKQQRINLDLPSKFKKLNGPLNSLRTMMRRNKSDPRIDAKDIKDLDSYLQFDQMQTVPKRRSLKTFVILYDLIPYVMESEYLWNYKTGRRNGDSRKSSLRKALLRHQYMAEVRAICKNATSLIAISEHTKKDFVKIAGVKASKIHVVHLGVDPLLTKSNAKNIEVKQYIANSWDYTQKPINLTDKPYLLFVGGADPRRKLIDLVAAYNNLKARGYDIRLVLAGDIMKGPKAVPDVNLQKYIADSSYVKDIVFLGFVDDEQRDWLYKHALAFVYPSVYEGFGLPVLEAMQYGTPVITYNNTSIAEIADNAAIFAEGALGIANLIPKLLGDHAMIEKYSKAGKGQASKFSWSKTTGNVLDELVGL